MISKIYLNRVLSTLPVGALFRYNGAFYWRGYALRGIGRIRVYTDKSCALRSQSILPSNSIVQYYAE